MVGALIFSGFLLFVLIWVMVGTPARPKHWFKILTGRKLVEVLHKSCGYGPPLTVLIYSDGSEISVDSLPPSWAKVS